MKVRFELDILDWHGHGSETLWAEPITKSEWRHFRIKNSPFFTLEISNLDIVEAIPTADNRIFDFRKIIDRSGHSTYMLILETSLDRVVTYWRMLEKLGCSYESMHINLSIGEKILYSVDVPPHADIYEVYEIMERGKENGLWLVQAGHVNTAASQA